MNSTQSDTKQSSGTPSGVVNTNDLRLPFWLLCDTFEFSFFYESRTELIHVLRQFRLRQLGLKQ